MLLEKVLYDDQMSGAWLLSSLSTASSPLPSVKYSGSRGEDGVESEDNSYRPDS